MAERTPAVKKYRDALETVISATMEFMARPTGMEQREIESRADHEVVQSLLGLSAQQSPDQIKLPSLKRNRAFLEDDSGSVQRNGGGMDMERLELVRRACRAPPQGSRMDLRVHELYMRDGMEAEARVVMLGA